MDKILTNKGVIRNPKDGSQIVPLEQKSYNFGLDRAPIEGFYYVSKSMEMRSDLFALLYSSSINDEWAILKYNNISNPFTLKEGDVLAIPVLSEINRLESTPKKRESENPRFSDSKENIKDQFKKLINFTDRETPNTNNYSSFKQKYAAIEESRKKAALDILRDGETSSGNLNVTQDLLPPNFADGNKGEFKIQPNGEVILGSSVASSGEDCDVKTTTKAELINALIKNRVVR